MVSIGFLVGTTFDAWKDDIKAFETQLGTYRGFVFNIEYQMASGQGNPAAGPGDFYKTIATDFADPTRGFDFIVTGGTDATIACINAANAANPHIKIVFATAGREGAYLQGLSKSGNVTGISNQQCDPVLVAQRLDHMNKNVPASLATAFTTFGVIGNANADNVANPVDGEIAMVVAEAPFKGLTAVKNTTASLQTVADIPWVIQEVKAKGAQALYVCTDPLITSNADIVNEWAAIFGLPTMHAFKKNSSRKGTLYYGPKLEDMFTTAADFVYSWSTTGTRPALATPTGSPEHNP